MLFKIGWNRYELEMQKSVPSSNVTDVKYDLEHQPERATEKKGHFEVTELIQASEVYI